MKVCDNCRGDGEVLDVAIGNTNGTGVFQMKEFCDPCRDALEAMDWTALAKRQSVTIPTPKAKRTRKTTPVKVALPPTSPPFHQPVEEDAF